MKLITDEQRRRLLNNGRWNATRLKEQKTRDDFHPIVKLFAPWSGTVWLLTELDPEQPDYAFGLCDTGRGLPKLDRVQLSAIAALRGPGGLMIERDRHFRPTKTLQAYAADARRGGRITA